MADEITLNASIVYEDSEGSRVAPKEVIDLLVDVATKKFTTMKVSVGTTEEAVPLGESTAPGWFYAKNLDGTNFVEVRVATSGAKFAKLLAGEFCLLRLGSGAQVPYWIADTAACQVEYAIFQT